MLNEKTTISDHVSASAIMNPEISEGIGAPKFHYALECIGPDGQVKWSEDISNLVTTQGKTDLIDKYFKGSAYTAAWFLGLKGVGSAAVGDTLASHAGWLELTPYTGNRPAITFGTTTAGSNTATAVSYAITGTATVAGAFIASVNSGSSGILYSAGDFSVARGVANGDTLNVTVTVSATEEGRFMAPKKAPVEKTETEEKLTHPATHPEHDFSVGEEVITPNGRAKIVDILVDGEDVSFQVIETVKSSYGADQLEKA